MTSSHHKIIMQYDIYLFLPLSHYNFLVIELSLILPVINTLSVVSYLTFLYTLALIFKIKTQILLFSVVNNFSRPEESG